jgi:hypothetical protein
MIRMLAVTAFAGSFLALSPQLRLDTLDAISDQMAAIERHSPYSWVGLTIAGLVMFCIYMRRCSMPR